MKFFNFCWQNYTTTTTKYFDVPTSFFLQQVIHILKVLIMAALVAGYCNRIGIFLYRTIHNFFYAPVVSQVYDFGTSTLHYATHNINGRIMSVE